MRGLLTGLLVVLLGTLCFTLFVAVRRRNVAASVNALFAVLAAVLSVLLAAGLQLPWNGTVLAPALPIWVTVAGILHAIGMLGPYDSVWWWDHLTHTVSATLVAAVVYAALIVTLEEATLSRPSLAVAVGAVVVTFLIGVFWELVELVARAVGERYDIEPVLVHYGLRDTAFDLAFDLLGAVLVVAVDLRVFVDLFAAFPGTTRTLLVSTASLVTVGSLLITVLLGASASRDGWGGWSEWGGWGE